MGKTSIVPGPSILSLCDIQSDDEREKSDMITCYKNMISLYAKNKLIDLLELSYMIDFENVRIVNSLWFATLVNKILDSEKEEERKKEFCGIVSKIFGNLFEFEDSEETKLCPKKITVDTPKTIDSYTDNQQQAITDITNFIADHNKKIYGLFGYAGTGKTTTIVEIVYFLLANKYVKSIALTAPTNKACDVMKDRFKPHLVLLYEQFVSGLSGTEKSFDDMIDSLVGSGITIEFITIHKLLNFELDYEADGNINFVRNKDKTSNIDIYEIVVIDECSMIPASLVDNILLSVNDKIKQSGDNYKKSPKVIFSGDPAQLPPVDEQLSIIFYSEHDFINCETCKRNNISEITKKSIANMPSITLTEVMRSKLNNVTKVCYQIRLWAIGSIQKPKIKKYIKKSLGVSAYKYDGKQKTDTEWFKKFVDNLSKDNCKQIILTWTNKQCNIYNDEIRKIIFRNKEKINKYEIGDCLMLNEFYSIVDTKNKNSKFYTSEQIKIIDVEVVEKKIKQFVHLNTRKQKTLMSVEKMYNSNIDEINKNISTKYKCWKLLVNKAKLGSDSSCIYVIHDDSRGKWIADQTTIFVGIKRIRALIKSKHYDKINVMNKNVIKPLWREHHNNMINPFAVVNYGYSITCHKAQGSNFHDVFVDTDDICKNSKTNEAKKCVYTAVTRTSNELHLLL